MIIVFGQLFYKLAEISLGKPSKKHSTIPQNQFPKTQIGQLVFEQKFPLNNVMKKLLKPPIKPIYKTQMSNNNLKRHLIMIIHGHKQQSDRIHWWKSRQTRK